MGDTVELMWAADQLAQAKNLESARGEPSRMHLCVCMSREVIMSLIPRRLFS